MNRRSGRSIAAVLLGAALLLGGCAKNTGTKTARVTSDGLPIVQYGYQPGNGQAIVASEKGFYDEQLAGKAKVQLQKFQSGPSLITAMTSGSLDFGQVGDQPAIQGKANHVDLKIIGKYLASDKVNGLIVRADSGIESVKDLKGKKVGVTVGSTGQQLLYLYLEKAGMKPADIRQVNLQPGDIVSSITFRNIDAAVTWEPYISLTVSHGTTKQLADGTGVKTEIDVIVAQQSFLKAHPDIAAGILKAQQEAGEWIDAHPDEALALTAKDAGLDKSVLEPIFNKVKADEVNLTDENIESIKQSIAFSEKYKLIKGTIDPSDFIDTQYLAKAGLR